MIVKERERILKNLEKIRKKCCVCIGERCDCKFGAENPFGGAERGNGCPEIRNAIFFLERITPEEYDEIVKRPKYKRSKKDIRAVASDLKDLLEERYPNKGSFLVGVKQYNETIKVCVSEKQRFCGIESEFGGYRVKKVEIDRMEFEFLDEYYY